MRIVIIGGGVSGIQAASVLTKIGCTVVVYDQKRRNDISEEISLPELWRESRDSLNGSSFSRYLSRISLFFKCRVIRVENENTLYKVYYEKEKVLYHTYCDFVIIATSSYKYYKRPPPESNKYRGEIKVPSTYETETETTIVVQRESESLKATCELLENLLKTKTRINLITHGEFTLPKSYLTNQIKYYTNPKSLSDLFKCQKISIEELQPDTKQVEKAIEDKRILVHRNQEIKRYEQDGVLLSNEIKVTGDKLIFCDASRIAAPFLARSLQDKLYQQKDGLYNYKKILPPKLPTLAYIGTEIECENKMMVTFVQSLWLAHHITHKMRHKSKIEMVHDIKRERVWRHKRYEHLAIPDRGSALYSYSDAYMRSLLDEMGGSKQSIMESAFKIYDELVKPHYMHGQPIKQLVTENPQVVYSAIKRSIP